MKKLHLYPAVQVRQESFKNVKKSVVPNQSLSLREIIARFLRKESLPIAQEGFYEDRFGDLEKMQHEDITQKHDRIDHLKGVVKEGKKREKDALEKVAKEKKEQEDKFLKELEQAKKDAAPQKPQGPANSPPS